MMARRHLVLSLVVLGATLAVFAVATLTRERIAANQRAWFVARLEALVPKDLRDNDLYADRITITAPDWLGSNRPIEIFRARRGGAPTAAILTAVATDGYGGPIELLVSIDYAGTVLGVYVLRHQETEGIGDGFHPRRSDWLTRLRGRSLVDPPSARWTIRKEGGDFDQFTGASITPRAILRAVRRTLEYYAANRHAIFNAPAQ